MTQIGMNQGGLLYWNDDEILCDHMKMAGDWDKPANILAMDENGWPTKISGPVTTYVPMTGVITPYIIRWEGEGTFKLSRFYKPKASGPGWLTVDTASLPNPDSEVPSNGFTILTIDPADPIRNISIVEEANDAAHQAGEMFDPQSVAQMRGYAELRFMDWMRSNEHLPDSKAAPNFPRVAARSYFWGAPLEVCLKFAEKVGARAWVNIPLLATEDEIRAFGRACPPDADIEWSNELTWNVGFAQGEWFDARAKSAGVEKAVWAGREHARVAKLLESVGRKLVVGYQPTAKVGKWDAYTKALIEAGGTSRNISRVMTTCYPTGGGLNSIKALTPFMLKDDRAGVIAALLKDVNDNLPSVFTVAKTLADKLGVPWSVYEGNVAHLNTSAGLNTCVAFVEAVQRDPAIREVGERALAIAEEYGCDVFNVFNWSGQPSRQGFFGVKGTPFGALLDERRTPVAAPLTLEERVSLLERQYATLSASINGGLK